MHGTLHDRAVQNLLDYPIGKMYTFSLVLTHADSMNEFRVGETFEQLTVVSIWKMKHNYRRIIIVTYRRARQYFRD